MLLPPASPYLYVQLDQGCEAVDEHKGSALLVGVVFDPQVSSQFAVGAPAKLAPCDVAKCEHDGLKEKSNACHCFVSSVCCAVTRLIRVLNSGQQTHQNMYQLLMLEPAIARSIRSQSRALNVCLEHAITISCLQTIRADRSMNFLNCIAEMLMMCCALP